MKKGNAKEIFLKVILILAVVLIIAAMGAGATYYFMRRNVSRGADGVGIQSISPNGKDKNGANVYKVTLTDGTYYTFTVPQGQNGADGEPGADGANGITPHIGDNGNWYIGDVDTGVKAEGQDGADGQNAVLTNTGCVATGSGVFGYDQNENVCCIGYAQYFRTGQSSGYLNLSISLCNSTDTDYYRYIDLGLISSVLGINIKQPDGMLKATTGYWIPIAVSDDVDLIQNAGYSATCVYNESNYICLSRIYMQNNSTSGAWGLNILASNNDKWHSYALMGIEVEEEV